MENDLTKKLEELFLKLKLIEERLEVLEDSEVTEITTTTEVTEITETTEHGEDEDEERLEVLEDSEVTEITTTTEVTEITETTEYDLIHRIEDLKEDLKLEKLRLDLIIEEKILEDLVVESGLEEKLDLLFYLVFEEKNLELKRLEERSFLITEERINKLKFKDEVLEELEERLNLRSELVLEIERSGFSTMYYTEKEKELKRLDDDLKLVVEAELELRRLDRRAIQTSLERRLNIE
ncbi:Golgi-associated RAB2 interactor protein 2-like [Hydra vulgaris]|uniref:Golgi-associated RAB2 interactor protein 2-like n=1 Tax=Hydra vulgaris TaxID=6087 RepID=UPI0032EA84B1